MIDYGIDKAVAVEVDIIPDVLVDLLNEVNPNCAKNALVLTVIENLFEKGIIKLVKKGL
jgi:hypothetical protein